VQLGNEDGSDLAFRSPHLDPAGYGWIVRPAVLGPSTRVFWAWRAAMTKVLLSPSFDHGPGGTSLKSTNFQSVTSVSSMPRKSRTAGETSTPAPLFSFGLGRS